MTIPQAWDLAQKWYGTRLEPDFRRPTIDEAQAIFESVGLTGSFWNVVSVNRREREPQSADDSLAITALRG
jgi:hypothetical protein